MARSYAVFVKTLSVNIMFIVLLICDELESVGDKDSASENRGKSEKKKKGNARNWAESSGELDG